MKKYTFIIIITCFAKYSSAQKNILSILPKKANNIEAFIPKNYDTLATTIGDLNKDGLPDIAMVLAHQKEITYEMETEPARLLVILFKNKNGYQLADVSDQAVMCRHCGGVFGDPFEGISILNNVLTISHYGGSAWRWGYNHKFKFQKNDFYLIAQSYLYYWDVEYCDKLEEFAATKNIEENFVTGDYSYKEINQDCTPLKKEHRKNPIKPLQTLSSFNINKNIQ